MSATTMRLTELSYSQIEEPVQAEESVQAEEPVQGSELVCYGPPQWARRSYTKGFAGADFALQSDGTLCCPAGHPLYAQERRREPNGSLRVLYAARLCHCRPCPLRAQCQENGTTTIKPRRVSAVFRPLSPTALAPPDELTSNESAPNESVPSCPVRWGDGERCQIRRRWFHLLRTQTVLLAFGPVEHVVHEEMPQQDVQTRALRAHWRLSWKQRLARNARPPTAPPLEVTIHGLPVLFAQSFGFDVVTAA
ncbi:MAG TPA: hypothetical protein VGL94_05305 [Ktedonobacteraceae bacterium]